MQARVKKRKLRLLFYLSILSLTAGYFYFGLCPGILKDRFTMEIYTRSSYLINFSTVHYIPFKGFVFRKVYVDPTQQLPNGFYTDTLSILPDWSQILQNKISIKEISAKSAFIDLSIPLQTTTDEVEEELSELEEINDSSFFDTLGKTQTDTAFPFLKTEIECLKCTVLLPENNPLKINQLTKIDFKLSLTDPELIPIQLSMKIGSDIKVRLLKGIYKPSLGQISIFSKGYLSDLPAVVQKYIAKYPFEITAAKGFYSMESMIELPTLQSDTLSARFKINLDEIQLSGKTKDAQFHSVQKLELNGFLDSDSKLQVESANIEILDSVVTMNQSTSPILIDSGFVRYAKKNWNITDVLFTWQNSQFKTNMHLSGSPYIAKGEIIQTSRTLNMWKPFFPDSFEGPIDYDSLEADLITRIVFDGPLSAISQNIQSIQLGVEHGSVSLKKPFSKKLTDISGKIEIKNERYFFKSLTFKCNDRPFSFMGELDKSGSSNSKFEIRSKEMKATVDSLWDDNAVVLNKVQIQAPGILSNFKGVISNLKVGEMDINGDAELNTSKLKLTFKELGFKNQLAGIPIGTMKSTFELNGIISNLETLKGSIKLSSPLVTFFNFPLQTVEVDANLQRKVLNIPFLRGLMGGGEVRGKGQIDFALEGAPYFQLHAFADKVDLSQFIASAGIDYKKTEGVLHLDTMLEGYFNKAESIQGTGHFRALGGTIWETDRYSKLGNIPFLRIDGIRDVVFRSADGSFSVKNGRIVSEDIVLNSRNINLHLRGVLEIGGLLNFDLISRFSPSLIKETQQLGNVASTVIRIAEEKISQYKILGTLTNPILQET